jgi:FkbM family methyltransferase
MLAVRPTDSDPFVACQIFGSREYEFDETLLNKLNELSRIWKNNQIVPVIVDAGANVGYSSIFFAENFPDATIVAIEPDPSAFALLEKNCASCDRIVPLNAALWKHDGGVQLQNTSGPSWARRVADEGLTTSYTLASVLATIPRAEPLILKLDIEGAEREVCEEARKIVAKVPCILIEPHDWMLPGAGCLSPLLLAIAGKKMDIVLKGENLILFESTLLSAK